jgi:hypothetical protein
MATARTDRTLGVPGIALVLAGAVALMLSFTTTTWYAGQSSGPDSISRITFSTLHHLTSIIPGAPSSTKAYFGWLAWVLLLLGVIIGVAANVPWPVAPGASIALRVAGAVLGVLGMVVTYYAMHKLFAPSGASVFTHSRAGLWLAFVGYAVIAAGAAIGPLPPHCPPTA